MSAFEDRGAETIEYIGLAAVVVRMIVALVTVVCTSGGLDERSISSVSREGSLCSL